MKKQNILLVALFAILPLTSCEDYLDNTPDNIVTLEMVFNSKDDTEQWLNGIYQYVRDPLWGWVYNDGHGALSDDMIIPTAQAEWGGWAVKAQQGNWTAQSEYGTDVWRNTYKAVRQAKLLEENIKPLPGLSEALIEDYKNQANFLMLYYYTRVLEMYGPCPLVTELVPSDAPYEELMMERTPYDDIVSYLDRELLALADKLPLERRDDDYGRPTRGACLAVRAKMLLFAASKLFNGCDYYKDVANLDGTKLFPQQEDPNKWRKAADAYKLVINLAENENLYELYKEYNADGSIDPFLSLNHLFTAASNANPEVIWGRASSSRGDWMKATAPRGCGGYGFAGATQSIVDEFYDKNGKAIEDSPVYTENGFSVENDIRNTKYSQADGGGTEGLVTPAGTYNMYVNREPRFYNTILYNGCYYPTEGRGTRFEYNGWDGGPSLDSPVCGYLVRKQCHWGSRPREGSVPYYQGIIIRLAEVYLGYVEALNECDPTNPDITKYLNLIHERAGIPSVEETYPEIIGNKELMREYIRKERRIELAFERDCRYNDLRRWMIAEEEFDKPITGMNFYGGDWTDTGQFAYFKRTNAYTGKKVFMKKEYLWPINQSYIDNNPNLIQNKDW